MMIVMAIALLAAALLAHAPTPLPTARRLYDECRLYVADQERRAATGSDGPEQGLLCELEASSVDYMNTNGLGPRLFCAPASLEEARDRALQLARIFMARFERDPAANGPLEGEALFREALAEKWPCPR